jgi:predicted transcriptional regulator
MLVIMRQIKAARSLIGWEQHQLALQSGVAISTIRRLEGLKGGAIGAHFETIEKIRTSLLSGRESNLSEIQIPGFASGPR